MRFPCTKMKFPCMKMKIQPKIVMDENSMDEIVYSRIAHEHFLGEKNIPGAIFPFSCMKTSLSCTEMSFPCMHEIFMP